MIFAENNSNSSGELEGAEPEAGESTALFTPYNLHAQIQI